AACFRKVIELDPKNANAHLNLGYALQLQGKAVEAIACYRKAIELDPKNGTYQVKLGEALQSQGKTAEPIACYRKVIEVTPEIAGAYNNLAWLLVTCAELKLRDAAEAVKLGRKAVELAPRSGSVWNTLGVVQYRAGDWQGSLDALKKSMELRKGGDA